MPVCVRFVLLIFAMFVCMIEPCHASMGNPGGVDSQLRSIEDRVAALESEFPIDRGTGGVAFLFGVVCALWAKNSGRNAWLWFFMGLFFTIITALVMLYKNGADREAGHVSW